MFKKKQEPALIDRFFMAVGNIVKYALIAVSFFLGLLLVFLFISISFLSLSPESRSLESVSDAGDRITIPLPPPPPLPSQTIQNPAGFFPVVAHTVQFTVQTENAPDVVAALRDIALKNRGNIIVSESKIASPDINAAYLAMRIPVEFLDSALADVRNIPGAEVLREHEIFNDISNVQNHIDTHISYTLENLNVLHELLDRDIEDADLVLSLLERIEEKERFLRELDERAGLMQEEMAYGKIAVYMGASPLDGEAPAITWERAERAFDLYYRTLLFFIAGIFILAVWVMTYGIIAWLIFLCIKKWKSMMSHDKIKK
ncbi:DUF4349 domain-containing protein [bacterium]|nr:DUF4349 domain-containing protein [bacterium]